MAYSSYIKAIVNYIIRLIESRKFSYCVLGCHRNKKMKYFEEEWKAVGCSGHARTVMVALVPLLPGSTAQAPDRPASGRLRENRPGYVGGGVRVNAGS